MKKLVTASLSIALTATALTPFSASASGYVTQGVNKISKETNASNSTINQEKVSEIEELSDVSAIVDFVADQEEAKTGENITEEQKDKIAELINTQLTEEKAKLEKRKLKGSNNIPNGSISIQSLNLTDSEVVSYYQDNLGTATSIRNIYYDMKETDGTVEANTYRLAIFYAFVKSGGPWDLKQYLGTKTEYYFKGGKKTGEYIGNHHYGYMGKAIAFPDTVLKAAAGMYQVKSGTSDWKFISSYFDDPKDQSAITDGLNDYKSGYRFGYVIA